MVLELIKIINWANGILSQTPYFQIIISSKSIRFFQIIIFIKPKKKKKKFAQIRVFWIIGNNILKKKKNGIIG